ETRVTVDVAEVRVTYTGCGIAPGLHKKIFEPFFTTKSPGKGTGLGLYNARNIVHQMHGDIAVDSEVDKGSTFTLTFLTQETVPQRKGSWVHSIHLQPGHERAGNFNRS